MKEVENPRFTSKQVPSKNEGFDLKEGVIPSLGRNTGGLIHHTALLKFIGICLCALIVSSPFFAY